MAVINKNTGLWSLKIDISEASEDLEIKAKGLWIEFRGMRKDELARFKASQAETSVNAVSGIVLEFEDEKGKERTRTISPEAINKRNAFLDKLVGDCIIDHNFESEPNKKISNADVWAWIGDRAELYDFIIFTWQDKHPFFSTKTKSDKN